MPRDARESSEHSPPAPLSSKARRKKRHLPAHHFMRQENSAHFRIFILSLVSYGLQRSWGEGRRQGRQGRCEGNGETKERELQNKHRIGFSPSAPTALGVSTEPSCGLINSSERIIKKFALARTYFLQKGTFGGTGSPDNCFLSSPLCCPTPNSSLRKKQDKGGERRKKLFSRLDKVLVDVKRHMKSDPGNQGGVGRGQGQTAAGWDGGAQEKRRRWTTSSPAW